MVPHLEYSFAALNILSQWNGFVNVEGDGVDKGRDSNGERMFVGLCKRFQTRKVRVGGELKDAQEKLIR